MKAAIQIIWFLIPHFLIFPFNKPYNQVINFGSQLFSNGSISSLQLQISKSPVRHLSGKTNNARIPIEVNTFALTLR